MKAIDKAITKAGTASRLAKLLTVSAMTISHWRNRYKGVVPADRVLPIYSVTGVTPTNCAPISTQTQPTVYLNRSLKNANCFISSE